jgi:hypothetical protein
MFEDLFDFGKTRTLKQSVGFFLFYCAVAISVSGFFRLMGVR